MTIGICKFCLEEKELINSHIIPKSFFNLKKFGSLASVNINNNKFDKSPHHQSVLKEHLMCHKCDNHLGKLDNYANNFFHNVVPNTPREQF